MWFGTEEYMQDVKAPATGASTAVSARRAGGQFLGGGMWQRQSGVGARTYNWTWPIGKHHFVRDVLDGVYGELLYALHPAAKKTNCLPLYMSAPWRGVPGWGDFTVSDAPPPAPGSTITYRWTGAPNSSTSEEVAPDGVTVLRTNLSPNPRATSGGATVGAVGAGNAVVQGVAVPPSPAGVVTAAEVTPNGVAAFVNITNVDGLVASGPARFVRIAVRASVDSDIRFRSGISGGSFVALPANTWQMFEIPAHPAATNTQLTWQLPDLGVIPDTARLWWSEITTAGGPFFDGDTPAPPPPPGRQNNYPTKMATFDASTPKTYKFPVPPGHTVHFGAHGSGTGSVVVNNSNVSFIAPNNTSIRFNTQLSNVEWVDITYTGEVTLRAMQMVILPDGEQPDQHTFIGGSGQSGFMLEGDPSISEYNTVSGYGISANFREVEAWND